MSMFYMNNLGYALHAYCQMLARLSYGGAALPPHEKRGLEKLPTHIYQQQFASFES